MSGTHGHVFLELCCASDSELAAAVVEHSVAVRVTSSEDLQLASTRRALHRLLRICKAYDVVVDIWVSIQTDYHAARNLFERFRVFWELIGRFEFEFCRCGNYFLKDANFWCVHVTVPWPVCAHAFPFRMLMASAMSR